MRRLIFLRDFTAFSGGHLKVWHYFRHAATVQGFAPMVYFSERSLTDDSNPWVNTRAASVHTWSPRADDVLFLGGNDWATFAPELASAPHLPVINIVQGVRHADPGSMLIRHLSRRAIRICINPIITAALRPLQPRGPLLTIPIGLEIEDFGAVARRDDTVVAALKRPDQGREIAARLGEAGFATRLLDRPLSRKHYFAQIAGAAVALFLPAAREGFYLPPLEAMALGTIAVCPDCVGNRIYLHHGSNGFMPEDDLDKMIDAVRAAHAMSDNGAREMRARGRLTALGHDFAAEGTAFGAVLSRIDALWAGSA